MGRDLLVHVSPDKKDEDAIYLCLCKYAVLESFSTTTPAKRVALRSSFGEVQLRAWSRSFSSECLYVGSEPVALVDNAPFALSYRREIARPRNI